jgi:Fe-S cluster assembly scaffold protein SufB
VSAVQVSPRTATGGLLGLASAPDPRKLGRASGEPDWLVAERVEGERLARELPPETNPLFTRYVDLRAVRFGEIAAYDGTGEAPEPSPEVPSGASAFLHVREDTVVARGLIPEATAAGVVVDTFSNVLRRDPALLRRLIEGGATLPSDDRFAQASRAAFTIGVLVHVPPSVRLRGPIVVRWSAGAAGRGLLSRTVISLGRGAQASLLEEHVASVLPNGAQSLWAGTSEVLLGAGATLEFAGQENFGPQTAAFTARHAVIQESASLRWALATVGGGYVKSRIDNLLAGRGASVQQVEIGLGSGSQFFDLTSYTRHRGEDTTGELLSKGVFLGQSRGYFKGLVDIERSARGTDSYLGEFAMLMTKKARSVAIPSLEIDQPDVRRAAHSSAVGPVDENQIFYLMSRGFSRNVARKFIVLGFLEPVVARIPLPDAQERLRGLLDRKWSAQA